MDILLDSLRNVMLALGFISLIVGLCLLLIPQKLETISVKLNRWYSSRRSYKALDVPHNMERFYYQHHKPIGVLVVIGSVYLLYFISFQLGELKLSTLFPPGTPLILQEITIDASSLTLFFFSIFSLLVGYTIFIRPSLLKEFEARSNQWFTGRSLTRKLDLSHDNIDQFAYRNHRIIGGLIILGSLYLLYAFLTL